MFLRQAPSYSNNKGYVRAYIAEKADSGKRNVTVNTVVFRDKLHFDGGNDVTVHRYVVRAMQSESLELPTDIVEYNFSLPNDSAYMESGDNVGIVIFLQDDDTKEMLQSTMHRFFTPESDDSSPNEANSNDGLRSQGMMIVIGTLTVLGIILFGIMLHRKQVESNAIAQIQQNKIIHQNSKSRNGHQSVSGSLHQLSKTGLGSHGKSGDEFTKCPHCSSRVKTKNFDSHLKRVHSLK